MRVLVLTQALRPDSPPDERDVEDQAAAVCAAVAASGHDVTRAEASLDLGALRRVLTTTPPDLVFNLVESLEGADELAPLAPAMLEGLGIPCTGSCASALALSGDKPRAKARWAARGLPTPAWRDRGRTSGALLPGRCILKPTRRDASQGIDDRSVVEATTEAELDDLLAARVRDLDVDCFAERYVEGREVSVTLLAQQGELRAIGVAEMEFHDFPRERPRILGYAAKWSPETFDHQHTRRRFWSPATEGELHERIARLAVESALALGVEGYARVDLRLDEADAPWILEVNANPCLAPDAGFLAAARQAGLGTEDVCAAILSAARAATPAPRSTATRPAEAPPPARQRPGPPVQLHDDLTLASRDELRALVERTGFFTAAEADVAVELLDEYWTKGELASGYRFVSARRDGELVGYACFGPVPCTDTSHDLYWIAVTPELQGQGLGRLLVERTLERVRAEGGRRLYLDTSSRPAYAATRAFYQSTGFRVAATFDDFYRPGDGKVVFVRDL